MENGGGGGRVRLFVKNSCQSMIVGNSSLLVLHRCGVPVELGYGVA